MIAFKTFTAGAALLIASMTTAVAQDTAAQDTTAAPAEASARIANGTQFDAWTVTCEALAVNETACVLSQRLVRRNDNVFLAEFLAFTSADGAREFLVARVPNGVYFPGGFAMKPAEGEVEETRFVWQSCSPELCEALIELTPEISEELEGAERLVAGYRPALGAEPLVFALSVQGLRVGLDVLAATKTKSE